MRTTDTLASLRAEARKKRPDVEGLVLRAWAAGENSLRMRPVPDLVGCGDHSCVVAKPNGMGTNGGCRCDGRELRRAVLTLKARLQAESLTPEASKAEKGGGE